MYSIKKKIIFTLLIIISIFIGTLLWKYISLPTGNIDIMGEYYLANYNSVNETLKYLLFIFCPLATFIGYEYHYNKKILFTFIKEINEPVSKIDYQEKTFYILAILFLIYIFLEFLSISFPLEKIDTYHEGQFLSSAFKSSIDGSLWSGSFVTVGIFYETISSKLIWEIFDNKSIGLARFQLLFYTFIFKATLLVLSFQICGFTNLNQHNKNLLFIIVSIFFFLLIDYNYWSVDLLNYRDFPIVISIILFLELIKKNSLNYLIILALSLMSPLAMLWAIDRGAVLNLVLIFISFYFIIRSEYKNFFFLILLVIFFWFLFYQFFNNEFNYFINNSISIFKEIDYVHGIIHPVPFSNDDNSARATKTLILIIFSILTSVSLYLRPNKKFSFQSKAFLLLLAFLCFLSYRYALGRSDGPHIRSALGFPLIFLSFYLLVNLFHYLEKNEYTNLLLKIKNLNFFILIFQLLLVLIFLNISTNNIYSFKKRFNSFINLEDKYFVNENTYESLLKLKNEINKAKCFQLFNYEAAIPYLIKVPNCTKYYYVWSTGSSINQKKMINEIKKKNTKYILSKGEINEYGGISASERLPLVNNYIKQNFLIYKKIGSYELLKKK